MGTVFVDCFDFDFFAPPNGAVEPGDRETAFERGAVFGTTEGELFTYVEDDGIYVDFDALFEISDEPAERVADLGEAKAHSLGVMGVFDGVDEIGDLILDGQI